MKVQTEVNKTKKDQPPRRLREFVDKIELVAENDNDARVLQKLMRIFMEVGTRGLNLTLDTGLEMIRDAKTKTGA